jgi:hypothetical protein
MASPTVYGYRRGQRQIIIAKVDSTSAAINTGDFLTPASLGYVKQAASGDSIIGVAASPATVPASDGLTEVEMDISTLSLYEYPGGATAVQTRCYQTCDIGGPQAIDENATTDDVIFIAGVTPGGNYLVSILPARTGVTPA